MFTVRSAYHLEMELKKQNKGIGNSSSTQKETAFWKKIWRMDVPPRVKIFIWKACKGILPTAQNIHKRLRRDNEECRRCGELVEIDKHIFFECYEARNVWRCMKDIQSSRRETCKSFKEWFALLMEKCTKEEIELIVITFWLLWKSRNEKIFIGTERGADQICKYSLYFLQEFQSSQMQRRVSTSYRNRTPSDSRWKPHAENLLKLNVGAAFKEDEASIGLIIRNSKGEIEALMTDFVLGCFDAQHAETIGFLRAIQFAGEYGITHFELEGDALGVINRINSTQEDLSMTGHLITGIRSLMKEFPHVKISHVPRLRNCPAQEVARIALSEKISGS